MTGSRREENDPPVGKHDPISPLPRTHEDQSCANLKKPFAFLVGMEYKLNVTGVPSVGTRVRGADSLLSPCRLSRDFHTKQRMLALYHNGQPLFECFSNLVPFACSSVGRSHVKAISSEPERIFFFRRYCSLDFASKMFRAHKKTYREGTRDRNFGHSFLFVSVPLSLPRFTYPVFVVTIP